MGKDRIPELMKSRMRKKTSLPKEEEEEEDITASLTEKKKTKKYCEQMHANKLERNS